MVTSKKYPFIWQGKNKQGKFVKGTIEAINITTARRILRHQEIRIKTLKRQTHNLSLRQYTQVIKSSDISAFARQLSTMVNAGVPMVQSLDIIAKSCSNKNMRKKINNIKNDIEVGTKLRDALAKHSKHFSEFFYNLIGVGEDSGTLGQMLERLATYQEKMDTIKRKIRKALFYPVLVIIVAFIVISVLLVNVIPEFETLFSNFNANLPAFTQIVIQLSEVFQAYWLRLLLIIMLAPVIVIYTRKHSKKFSRLLDRLTLYMPVFGKLIRKSIIARFTRTLATTFAAGMPLIDALKNVARSSNNNIYEEAILKIRDEVSTGQPLYSCLNNTCLFPNEVVQMVSIGEETGQIDSMLNKVATIYEQQVDDMVDGLSRMLEPFIMVIIGSLVGGLVIAMYLPIFHLGDIF